MDFFSLLAIVEILIPLLISASHDDALAMFLIKIISGISNIKGILKPDKLSKKFAINRSPIGGISVLHKLRSFSTCTAFREALEFV